MQNRPAPTKAIAALVQSVPREERLAKAAEKREATLTALRARGEVIPIEDRLAAIEQRIAALEAK